MSPYLLAWEIRTRPRVGSRSPRSSKRAVSVLSRVSSCGTLMLRLSFPFSVSVHIHIPRPLDSSCVHTVQDCVFVRVSEGPTTE